MNRQGCNRNECLIIALASSVVIGIVTAILSATEIITLTPAFLWVTLGIAVAYLAIAFIVSTLRRFGAPYSSRSTVTAFIAGILGTILFSVILLGIAFDLASPIGAVFSGLLLLFFALIITTTACLVLSAYNDD